MPKLRLELWLGLAGALLYSAFSQAHLLNMTQVIVGIDESRMVRIEMEVDLLRVLGSHQAYYDFSQKSSEQLFGQEYADLWDGLIEAIQLSDGEQIVPLEILSITPPREESLEDFQDPLIWPKTRFVLVGTEPMSGPQVSAVFATQFRFEEPISLSLRDLSSGKSKSRWLVANQSSPALVLSTDVASMESQGINWAVLAEDLVSYTIAGMRHIFPLGLDHMLFVMGLFFAARSNKGLVAQISIFTLAHSVSLIASAYGVIELPARPVEALIALSIVWIALMNLLGKGPGAMSYSSIFVFGLLHGLGFASALRSLAMPQSDFLLALLSFNVGVELAQLSFVFLLAILVMLLKGYIGKAQLAKITAVPSILIASYWTISRII